MDFLKLIFPFSFKSKDLTAFIIALVFYVIVCGICGAIIGFLAGIPIVGIIFSLLGSVLGLYGLIGIILSVLVFVKVIE